jgi:hypothetical protein
MIKFRRQKKEKEQRRSTNRFLVPCVDAGQLNDQQDTTLRAIDPGNRHDKRAGDE